MRLFWIYIYLFASFLLEQEEQTRVESPADDENSREVFGLIKKLNIVSENKKRPKTSCKMHCLDTQFKIFSFDPSLISQFLNAAIFDSMLTGGSSNSSSKVISMPQYKLTK